MILVEQISVAATENWDYFIVDYTDSFSSPEPKIKPSEKSELLADGYVPYSCPRCNSLDFELLYKENKSLLFAVCKKCGKVFPE